MKRLSPFSVFQSIFASIAIVLVVNLQSCKWFTPSADRGESENQMDKTAFCTAEFSDSLVVLSSIAYQEMKIDFPSEQDSSVAARAALEWLCDEVRYRCFPNYEGACVDSGFSVASADVSFAENVVSTYGHKGLQKMAEDIREIAKEGYAGLFGNYLTIELVADTKDFLTYTVEHDMYTGGAHGSQYHCGQTFSKSNGEAFSWAHFKSEKRPELIAMLKKGLMAYFNDAAEEPITTDSALFEYLMLYDDPDTPENELEYGLPLPQTQPWITRDGISFIYQEYEITAYALGRPTVTLPFAAVEPFLNDEGRKFITNVVKS